MATILELAAAGELVRLDPELEPDELEERCIYAFPHVIAQVESLEGQPSKLGVELTPLEQLYDLVTRFASGAEMSLPDQFHELYNRGDGIWELKTPDLRLFGWFCRRDCFVCTDIKDADFVKNGPGGVQIRGSLYPGFGDQAARRRDGLNLDQPKFVPGTHPENVISNYVIR